MSAWRTALCLLVLAIAPALARAQASTDLVLKEEKGVQFSVLWGFDGSSMYAERWSPVRIVVNSGDEPVSGMIEISYRQDASQTMQIVLPFATTPGVFVPVEAALALPSGCRSIRFELRNERGKRLRAHTFSRDSQRDNERMPEIFSGTGVALLSIGDTRFPDLAPRIASESFGKPDQRTPAPLDENWSRLIVARADPLSLPTASMAYDGLGAIVVNASVVPRISPATLDAIRRWVDAGGMIVAIADNPADSWRSLLSRRDRPDMLTLGPMASVTEPESFEELVETSPSLSARAITLTDAGMSAGWSQRWTESAGRSYVAEGPIGLGWAVVVGVDPRRVPTVFSTEQTAILWRDVLRDSLAHWSSELPPTNWYWGTQGNEPSGSTPRERAAISTVLDHALTDAGPSTGVFVLLIFAIVALAVLVGPVDAIGLKKLGKRQHSWATALAYTALACIPALFAPLLLRSDKTAYARSRCVDTLPPSLGGAAQQTAISSTFAGAPGPIRFTDPALASWWRPVSSLQTWRTSQGSGSRLACSQTSVATPQGVLRQNVPFAERANTQRLWTLRTVMDQGPAPAPPSAVLEDDLSIVSVSGLPDGATVVSASLMLPIQSDSSAWRMRWFELDAGSVVGARYQSPITLTDPARSPPTRWEVLEIPEENPWMWNSTDHGFRPSRLADLPGARARTRAIDAYTAAGRYALLQLELQHENPDVGLSARANATALEVHRIIIPVPEQTP